MPRQSGALLFAGFVLACSFAAAQSPDRFFARLSWVPISLAEQHLVAGQGQATATLSRGRLSIRGSYNGLPASATAARLHRGATTGAQGPVIGDLEVTPSRDGTFSGEIELDRAQRAALLAGHLYIQLYAEPGVPPDNAILRGWLLDFDETAAGSGRRN
jgi:hypothetical protein